MKRTIRRGAIVALFPLLLGLAAASCDPGTEYQRGPAPTEASLVAATGPYSVGTITVPTSAGFGGGTIYYPTGTNETFGAVAFFPGFIEDSTWFTGWGPKLASNGFVTIMANSTNGFILPDQRSTEQLQALDYLRAQNAVTTSPLHNKIDTTRSAIIGHSMGGGGTLISTTKGRTDIKAAIPLAPWNTTTSYPADKTPTFIYACQSDAIAPVAQHASPSYDGIPSTTKKSYLSITGGDHFCANSPANTGGTIGKFAVAWLKRFVDSDQRYAPWVCGTSKPATGSTINEVRSTCPF